MSFKTSSDASRNTIEPDFAPGKGAAERCFSCQFDPVLRERIVEAIGACMRVASEESFVAWVSMTLRTLIPHQRFIAHIRSGDVAIVREVRQDEAAGSFPQVSPNDEQAVVLRMLERRWVESGRVPQAIPAVSVVRQSGELASMNVEHTPGRWLVHGAGPLAGGAVSNFALFEATRVPDPLQIDKLVLLAPFIHIALISCYQAPQNEPVRAAPPESSILTNREAEILQWIFEGKTNQQIGLALGISPFTVKNHLQRIFRKLGVGNRAQAVVKALALRLVSSTH